ncbi:MAG: hypothetical protein Q8K60_07355 [Parachlamydiaceae bacterium]|nr:hypothetical protein [Parachlamydiaceae bacterium]
MCGDNCINDSYRIQITYQNNNRNVEIKRSKLDQFFKQINLYEKGAELFEKTFHFISPFLKIKLPKESFQFLDNMHHGAHHIHKFFHASIIIYDVLNLINYGINYLFSKKENSKNIKPIDPRDIDPNVKYEFSLTHSKLKWLKVIINTSRFASHLLYSIKFLQEIKIIKKPIAQNLSKYIHILNTISFSVQIGQNFVKFNKFMHNKKHQIKPLDSVKMHDHNYKFIFKNFIIKSSGLISSSSSALSKITYFDAYNDVFKTTKQISGFINTLFVYWNLFPKSTENFKFNRDDLIPFEVTVHHSAEVECSESICKLFTEHNYPVQIITLEKS